MSLGPVPTNQCKTDRARVRSPVRDPAAESHFNNHKLLCPSRQRAILPHGCDQRYGRDEYASDVSDTDVECEIIPKRVGCLLDKTKKKRHGRRIVFNQEKMFIIIKQPFALEKFPRLTVQKVTIISCYLRRCVV